MELIRINNELFFAKNIRQDGRKFMEHRDLLANLNPIDTADTSIIIKLGNTTVLCGIKFLIDNQTTTEDLLELRIVPNCLEEEQPDGLEICSKLEHFIRDSKLIDYKTLEYTNSDGEKRFFTISIELDCLNNDGNIFDAFLVALLGALNMCKVPSIHKIIKDNNSSVQSMEVDEDKSIQLAILKYPVSVTFVMIRPKVILLDPTRDEENLANSKLKVVFNAIDGKVMLIEKTGGFPLDDSVLVKLILSAKAWATMFYNTSPIFHPEAV